MEGWKGVGPINQSINQFIYYAIIYRYKGEMSKEGITTRIQGWRKAVEKSMGWVETAN